MRSPPTKFEHIRPVAAETHIMCCTPIQYEMTPVYKSLYPRNVTAAKRWFLLFDNALLVFVWLSFCVKELWLLTFMGGQAQTMAREDAFLSRLLCHASISFQNCPLGHIHDNLLLLNKQIPKRTPG